METRLREGGRLVYAGAGTSGRLAVQDGAELMPTFSWPEDRLLLLLAGGEEAMVRAVEGAEDEIGQAAELIRSSQHRREGRHHRGGGKRRNAVYPCVPARSEKARCVDDWRGEQPGRAASGRGRLPDLP